jgi:thioredoxin reductase (NADPH)
VRVGRVEALEREQGDGFVRSVGDESLIARTVVLATGAEDVAPPIADLDGAIHRGVLRHCPPATPTRCGTAALPSSVRAPVA